jgi:DNA replication protein DnaC
MTFILVDDTANPCECREIRLSESILKNSGINEEFSKKTFDNFDYSIDLQLTEALAKAKRYYHSFEKIKDTRRNSIIFMGQVGSGKTHLSIAIANGLIKNSIGVVYMPYRDTITKIKQSILDEENYNRELKRYKEAKVLLIDDLFKGSITKSDINIMFELINYRYLTNKPIIVSTEKTFDDLIEIDEAIGSRIVEMCKEYLVEIKGKKLNYRIYGG